MNLVDRFRYVMKVYNETPSSFADKIGVQRSSISHILSERNKPSLDFIQKILEHYPKVDAQWLINGKQSSQDQLKVANEPKQIDEGVEKVVEEKVSEETLLRKEAKSLPPESKEVISNSSGTSKQVDRIIVFYTDNTFETFNPSH